MWRRAKCAVGWTLAQWAVLSAIALVSASAADVNPPTRWWEVPADRFLEPAYLAYTRKNPQHAGSAKQAMQAVATRIDTYRDGIKDKIEQHAAKRQANLRLRFSDPETRTAWNDWKTQDRTLYEPIHALIREFEATLNGTPSPSPTGTSTPAVPTGAVMPAVAPNATGPDLADGESDPWASQEFIDTHLGNLPELVTDLTVESLRTRAKTAWGGPLPTDENTLGRLEERIRKSAGGFQKFWERHGPELDRLLEVIRLVRSHPRCLRQSDVLLIRAHWLELVDAMNKGLAGFDEDVRRLKS